MYRFQGLGAIDCSQPGPQESTYQANLQPCGPLDSACIDKATAAQAQFMADQQAYYRACSPGQTAEAQADYSNMMMQKYGAQVYGANAPAAITQAAQWNAAAVASAEALPAPSAAYSSAPPAPQSVPVVISSSAPPANQTRIVTSSSAPPANQPAPAVQSSPVTSAAWWQTELVPFVPIPLWGWAIGAGLLLWSASSSR